MKKVTVKKNQIVYITYGGNLEQFYFKEVSKDGKVVLFKMIGLDILLPSFDMKQREFIATGRFKKWWEFWK